MGTTVQGALKAPKKDLGGILAGVAAVLVAVTPLPVSVWLARPRNRRSKC